MPRATEEYHVVVLHGHSSPSLLSVLLVPHPSIFVSIYLYDTWFHLLNVSGLDSLPGQKVLIKPAVCICS